MSVNFKSWLTSRLQGNSWVTGEDHSLEGEHTVRGWYIAAFAIRGTIQASIDFLALCGQEVYLPAPETRRSTPSTVRSVQTGLHEALTKKVDKPVGKYFDNRFSTSYEALVDVSSRGGTSRQIAER